MFQALVTIDFEWQSRGRRDKETRRTNENEPTGAADPQVPCHSIPHVLRISAQKAGG